MIEVNGLFKKFGKNQVLDGLDLVMGDGGIIAILGPNGSGKTTLIKCLLGMVIPDKGTIKIGDVPIRGSWKYRSGINYMPQIADFPGNVKVRELFDMIRDLRQQPDRQQELAELFGLGPHLQKRLSTLSGGTKQKVNIVLSFMFDCPLLILDEPTTGLDPAALIRLKELIREEKSRGKTVLITSHIMEFVAEVADEVIYLLEGRIYFQGTVDELKKKTRQNNLEHAIAAITATPENA
ncbi:Cu-processing system ATP-binding protein [Muriicola jejuensis]|uniref:ATP-binding cassette domain-containing protein n=1 Tax=Muriicola jejuensis TaxID=504488 RepID=A0A6P0UEA7_9FLAO|nr:ABC transporter ATP-binding protein [Muriicola jejuensis]NER09603.1 ATP-binding cassette domain-containing protein [Muriicola jejuensis]SMP07482.1 Cu-processing system ATP-binding protein [Muriicola jejuensis]